MQSTCLETLEAAEWQSRKRETQSQNWIWHCGPTLSGAACLLFRAYWAAGSWCGMRRVKKREEITVRELATRGWALRLENKLLTHRNWEQRICGELKTGPPADGLVTPLSAADAEKTVAAKSGEELQRGSVSQEAKVENTRDICVIEKSVCKYEAVCWGWLFINPLPKLFYLCIFYPVIPFKFSIFVAGCSKNFFSCILSYKQNEPHCFDS